MKQLLKNPTNLFSLKQKNILSAAIVLMVMIFASSLLGLVRNRLLAGAFFSGQERLLDIYFAAFRIPDMIYQVLVLGALSAAFIPVFSEYLEKDKNQAFLIASSTINISWLIFSLIGIVVFIVARPLARLIAPTFNPEELLIMTHLLRLLLLAQGFFVLSSYVTGILQSFDRFLLPALSAVLYNVGIIIGILFFAKSFSIYGVVMGVILGAFLHFVIQLPLLIKLGFNYSLVFSFKQPGVRKIFNLIGPRTLGLLVSEVNLSVSIFLATSLAAGSLALFSFAQNIVSLPVSLFGLTIGQACLPSLSREAVRDQDKFKEVFLQSFSQVLYLSLPASIILIVLRVPVVRLVLGARNFPWEATLVTGKLVAIFALSIALQSLIQLLIRFFYAKQDTFTPLWISTIAVVVNIGLAWWLVVGLGLGLFGLGLATTLSVLVHGGLLLAAIKRLAPDWFDRTFNGYILRIFLINLLLAFSLWLLMRIFDLFLDTSKTLNLVFLTVATLAVSLILYVFLSWLFKLKEINSLFQVFGRFGQWRQILSQSDEILESQAVQPTKMFTEQG
jgi:putative peptidoglycan lipid II flippase